MHVTPHIAEFQALIRMIFIQRSVDDITYIEWNTTSAAGRVMDEVHYLDTDWHCWDAVLADVGCPTE